MSATRTQRRAGPTTAVSRLRMDYMRLKKDPVPYIVAEPLPSNLLEWHYVVTGPEQSPYNGGIYHGKLVFPAEFPFKPPSIYMITPNGRFKCNTRLCLSISDYHPDTWNPAWSVSTILTGLLSFMLEKSPTLGSIETTEAEKRHLAAQSLEFNLKDKIFCELFPELATKASETLQRKQQQQQQQLDAAGRMSYSRTGKAIATAGKANGSAILGAVTNFLVIGGFAAFAFLIQYFVTHIASATD